MFELFRDDSVGSPPLKFVKSEYRERVFFYGLSSASYVFFQLFNGMPDLIYIAGEHGEMSDDDLFVSYANI